MKPSLSLLLILSLALLSCKDKKEAASAPVKKANTVVTTPVTDTVSQAMMDSIRSFKPMQLSISTDHSDVDGLIPLGYNDHGSFAYLVDENSGGASGLQFGIAPAYQDFSLQARLGGDDEKDTILVRNKGLVTAALHSQGIRLTNTVQTITADSLLKKYGIKFEIKKTYGSPNPDDPSGKKTLASVEINWRQGDTEYPSLLVNNRYNVSYSIYDVYISDYLLVPGEEGIFGFVVLVTESLGFEGYTRKSIEVKQIGVVKGKE